MNNIEYKKQRSFQKRYSESSSIREKYPDRIPIICERSGNNIDPLDKKKFLAPDSISLGEFIIIIRRRLKLREEQAIFCFINNKLPIISSNLATLYKENKDEDGFLYIIYSGENCFGCSCFDIPCFKKQDFLLIINRLSSFNLFEKKFKKYDISSPDISLNNIVINNSVREINNNINNTIMNDNENNINNTNMNDNENDNHNERVNDNDNDNNDKKIYSITPKKNLKIYIEKEKNENDNISIHSDYSDYDVV